jgi:AraC family transcriptional regulator
VVDEVVIEPSSDQHIVLVISGQTLIQSRSQGTRWKTAEYGVGRIGLTPPGRGCHLRWRGSQRHRTTHISLPGSLMDSTAWQLWGTAAARMPRPNLLDTEDPVLVALSTGLCSAAAHGLDNLYAESAAALLAVHILTHHAPQQARTRVPAVPAQGNRRVHEVLAYLRANQAQPISLADMAQVARLSPFHFLRLFKLTTGTTPHRYLSNCE